MSSTFSAQPFNLVEFYDTYKTLSIDELTMFLQEYSEFIYSDFTDSELQMFHSNNLEERFSTILNLIFIKLNEQSDEHLYKIKEALTPLFKNDFTHSWLIKRWPRHMSLFDKLTTHSELSIKSKSRLQEISESIQIKKPEPARVKIRMR